MEKTQRQFILEALQSGKALTAIEALQYFGCFRLAARIAELRATGYTIKTRQRKTNSGKHIAEYYL